MTVRAALPMPNVLGVVAEVVSKTVTSSTEMAAAAATMPAVTTAASSAAAAAASSVTTASGGSFWGYVFSFLLGGMFFSTAFGVAALFISVGGDNVRRAFRVFQFLASRVWTLVVKTAEAVKKSLQTEGSTLADTRKVLEAGLAETQREVEESLKAFNQERDFYAAAVGLPGLRTAQYVLDHMMKGLIAQKLEESLANSIRETKHPNVKRVFLKSVNAGRSAPLLTGARFYDVGEDAMAFDVDMKWQSDVTATMDVEPAMGFPTGGLARVPVDLHDIKFDGTVRVLMTPMMRADPGYGAIVVSFPDPPAIGLDVRLGKGLEVNSVPWLRKVLSDAVKGWIKEEMLWPQRMLIPAERPPSAGLDSNGKPKLVLSPKELKAVLDNDPLLAAEERLTSLKESEKVKVKNMKHEDEIRDVKKGVGVVQTSGGDDGSGDVNLSGDDDIEVEITDPSSPVKREPQTHEVVLSWLKGATKVTVDKTLEVSKSAVDTSVKFAQSEDTRKVIKNAGQWWEKDVGTRVGGWVNNVAWRASGGAAKKNKGFPPAEAWTGDVKVVGQGNRKNGVKNVETNVNSGEAPNGNGTPQSA